MANQYPYISSSGPIVQGVTQFRKSFPSSVDASTLKKLGIASNNESYLINIFKFLKLIDDEGKKTEATPKVFTLHNDDEFKNAFGKQVKMAYGELFEFHSEEAWALSDEQLITFFRQSDQSSEIVGRRQANTFKALAGISGRRDFSTPRQTSSSAKSEKAKPAKIKPKKPKVVEQSTLPPSSNLLPPSQPDSSFGLSVRVEINLPAEGSQSTYDRIFKSIKENLIDAYKA